MKKRKYKTYLEIGVRNPNETFNNVKCPNKEGVDPDFKSKTKYVMTSDEFFEKISDDKIYDIIFIDGLHEYQQVLRDIKNSLKHLSIGGAIVLHDCNPLSRKNQEQNDKKKPCKWNGTVWKAFARLRMTNKNLNMYVVNIDNGCGVIERGSQKLFKKVSENNLTYNFLKKNRKKLLKLCSFREFRKKVITL